jgi:hypothetical protein
MIINFNFIYFSELLNNTIIIVEHENDKKFNKKYVMQLIDKI